MSVQSKKRLFVWGRDRRGSLGLGRQAVGEMVHKSTELDVENIEWAQIACGGDFTAAVSSNGEVITWGRGGALGHGDGEDRIVPTKVEMLSGETIVKVACNHVHMAAVSSRGKLFTWYVILIEIITVS